MFLINSNSSYATPERFVASFWVQIRKIWEVFLLLVFIALITGLVLYKVVFIANMPLIPSFWTIYGVIASVYLISRIPYAYLHRDPHDIAYSNTVYPNVSVVIAAKNEEKGIFRTITTCVESEYPGKLECIVIDDGSTDGTFAEMKKAEASYGNTVRLISFSENKGKREAMATGINEARHEIIVFVDSDSFLAPDAIRHITEHFLADEKIGAVSGNTKVENANVNFLTKMQSIQYAISFDVYKAGESVYRSVTCCPGCFSAYRRAAIQPLVKEWKEHKFMGSKSTFGDDRGLTNFVLQGWDIVYCEKAKATTIVPEKFRVYWKQQLRWKKSWIREGLFAGTFIWKKRHPMASFDFYVNFSFPIIGPILAGAVIFHTIQTHDPFVFIIFILGFVLLGTAFALFVRVYLGAEYWLYMPVVSFLFVSVFIWQMPWALVTLQRTHWGTR